MKIESSAIPDHILRHMNPQDRRALGKAGRTFEECETKRTTQREGEIHDQIVALLRLRGITPLHARMDKKTTMTVGWPDFTFAVRSTFHTHGIPVAIEVKRHGEKPSPEQANLHQKMRTNGWQVYVVHSVAEVKAILESLQSTGTLIKSHE